MRTLVVGDVHGCLDELLALLAAAGRRPDNRVVLVGNLVAKGPKSAGVVRWARESKADAVLGNHDAHVLRAVRGGRRVGPMHRAVADSLSAADVSWLESRPLFLRLDAVGDRPYLVVHGGVVPGIPIEEQTPAHLLNLRSITTDGEPSKRIEGAPWASLWEGPEHVVFGHDAVRGLQQHPFATGLDTGCVYGRSLTALVLPTGELVSVPAFETYLAIDS